MRRKLAVTVGITLGVFSLATTAQADTRGVMDWGRALVELDQLARSGAEGASDTARTAAERTSQLLVQNGGNAWFGVAPRVALVARDWGSAYRLAGDRLSLVDGMRLSESTRMVMSRVRVGDPHITRISPFAQVGVGQWRTDPNLLPLTPRSTELATQLGGGFELRLGRGWQLACETAMTVLVPGERLPGNLGGSRLWSTTVASRVDF